MYIYLIVAIITKIYTCWEYRKTSYVIMILGFLFCPFILLFHLIGLVMSVISYLKRKVKTDK